MGPNPIGGAGFETFWVGPRVAKIYSKVGGLQMTNEAHNGYIEVYLNLGSLAWGLLGCFLGRVIARPSVSFDAIRHWVAY